MMPQGVPGGGLPPGMGAPPGNVGAATIPQHNPGNLKQAAELLHIAQKALNEAIPKIPIASKAHAKAMKMALDLGKLIQEAGEEVQSSVQQMLQLMQQMKQDQASKGMGAISPPQPNQPPAMPPSAPPAGGAPPGM